MNKPMTMLAFVLLFIVTPVSVFAVELQLTPAQLANASLETAAVSHRESLTQLKLSGILTADRRRTHRVAPVVDGLVTTLRVVAGAGAVAQS